MAFGIWEVTKRKIAHWIYPKYECYSIRQKFFEEKKSNFLSSLMILQLSFLRIFGAFGHSLTESTQAKKSYAGNYVKFAVSYSLEMFATLDRLQFWLRQIGPNHLSQSVPRFNSRSIPAVLLIYVPAVPTAQDCGHTFYPVSICDAV